MTLEQLRIFLAVARHEHVTQAAKELRLTQSAVSGAIHALENRHQINLFDRVGRNIELSVDGRAFLEYASNVLRAADAAQNCLLDMKRAKRGHVEIYASQTTGTYWLPRLLATFAMAYPDIEIRVTLGNTKAVANAVKTGLAEIGFVESGISEPSLSVEQVGQDELVVVVAAGHHWPAGTKLGHRQILEAKWVLREPGSGTRSVFEQALRGEGIDPAQLNVSFELPSNEAIRAFVENGRGATAISRYVVDASLRSGTLRSVKFRQIPRPYHMLRHEQRGLSGAASSFLNFTREASERWA
jgi:DNA-binding transcriptional LysR family regulator